MSAQETPDIRVVKPNEAPRVDPNREIFELLADMDGTTPKLLIELQHATAQALMTRKKAVVKLELTVQPSKDENLDYVTVCPCIKTTIPDRPPNSTLRFMKRDGSISRSQHVQAGLFEDNNDE